MLPRNNPESKGTFIQAVTTLSGITGVVTGLIAIVVTLFGAGIFTSDPQARVPHLCCVLYCINLKKLCFA